MYEKEQLEAILRERDELRQEIIFFQKGQQQAILAFLTTLGIWAGAYWGGKIDESFLPYVLLFLTQVEVFVLVYMMQFASNMGVHSRYIAALEKRINELCESNVTLWESKVVTSCLFHPGANFYWTTMVMTVLPIGLLLTASWYTAQKIRDAKISCGWDILLLVEMIVLAGLWLWWALFDNARTEKHVERAFRESVIPTRQLCAKHDSIEHRRK
jgi:hypothetical protein